MNFLMKNKRDSNKSGVKSVLIIIHNTKLPSLVLPTIVIL